MNSSAAQDRWPRREVWFEAAARIHILRLRSRRIEQSLRKTQLRQAGCSVGLASGGQERGWWNRGNYASSGARADDAQSLLIFPSSLAWADGNVNRRASRSFWHTTCIVAVPEPSGFALLGAGAVVGLATCLLRGRQAALRQKLLDHRAAHVGQPEVAALEAVGEFRVVEAQ